MNALSITHRGIEGGRDGDVFGLERVGEVWFVKRNLRGNAFCTFAIFYLFMCGMFLFFCRVMIKFTRSPRGLCNILTIPPSLAVNFL